MKALRVLAIDTALGACSVCVYDATERAVLARESHEQERGHAEALLPMVERVIAASGLTFAQIDRIAVTVGPGSYTGLRVGVSAAHGLGLVTGKPVVGVSTLSALTAPLIIPGESSIVAAAIDARNDRIYLQVTNAAGRPIVPARHVAVREGVRMIGAGPVRLTGSAAPRLAVEAWSMGLDALVISAPAAPPILYVAHLGALADPEQARPVPLYLREPDAKPQTARATAMPRDGAS